MRGLKEFLDRVFFVYHGLVGVLFGILLFVIGNTIFNQSEMIKGLLNALGSTFVIGSLFGLLYTKISRDIHYSELRYFIEREETGFRKLFLHSKDAGFAEEIASRIGIAKEIKMFGIAINVLWDPDVINSLKKAAKDRRTKVTILLADVDSPQIQQRLHEEESFPFPSTEGKEVIENLYKHLKTIETDVDDRDFFEVRLFSHYPTFALIIADDDVFCYPYGYKAIGTISPVLYVKGNKNAPAHYFHKQFEVLLNSYPRQKS